MTISHGKPNFNLLYALIPGTDPTPHLAIWSGDPLDQRSRVHRALIGGAGIYTATDGVPWFAEHFPGS
jgi:hypothetical protein